MSVYREEIVFTIFLTISRLLHSITKVYTLFILHHYPRAKQNFFSGHVVTFSVNVGKKDKTNGIWRGFALRLFFKKQLLECIL